MSKTPKIYTESDFKNASTRLERIYMKMIQPNDFFLNNDEHIYYELLKKAWALLDVYPSIRKAAAVLAENAHISQYKAMIAVKDSQELLGPLLQVNKDYERAIIAARAEELYKLAIDAEDYNAAARALTAKTKALRLDKMDAADFHFDDLKLPDVEFTSDPKALDEGNIEDAQIIDEEE